MKEKTYNQLSIETNLLNFQDINYIITNALASRNHKKFTINDGCTPSHEVVIDKLKTSEFVKGNCTFNPYAEYISIDSLSKISLGIYIELFKTFSEPIHNAHFEVNCSKITNEICDSIDISYSKRFGGYGFTIYLNDELNKEVIDDNRCSFIKKFYSNDKLTISTEENEWARATRYFIEPSLATIPDCEMIGNKIKFSNYKSLDDILADIIKFGKVYNVCDMIQYIDKHMGSLRISTYRNSTEVVMDKLNSYKPVGPWSVNYGIPLVDATEIHNVFKQEGFTVTELYQFRLKGVGYANCLMIYEKGKARLQLRTHDFFEKNKKREKCLVLLQEYINSLAGRDICSGGKVW